MAMGGMNHGAVQHVQPGARGRRIPAGRGFWRRMGAGTDWRGKSGICEIWKTYGMHMGSIWVS
jgi:hypothetical protein